MRSTEDSTHPRQRLSGRQLDMTCTSWPMLVPTLTQTCHPEWKVIHVSAGTWRRHLSYHVLFKTHLPYLGRGPSLKSGEEAAATYAHQQLIVPAPEPTTTTTSSSRSQSESRPKVSCTTNTLSSDIAGTGSGLRAPVSSSNNTTFSTATLHYPARKDSNDSNIAACREDAPCIHQSPCADELPTANGNRPVLSDTTSGSIMTCRYEPPAYSNNHNDQHMRQDVRAEDAILCPPNGAISNTSACHGLELDSLLLGVGAWSVFR
ncbi:hypothetical protein V8F33_008197 [Rhypophila sp. PSN 637]